jgi:hypothetical protein
MSPLLAQSRHIALRSNSIFAPRYRTFGIVKNVPAEMNKPYYCDYAGTPTIVGQTRAWSFVQGAWKEINRMEAALKNTRPPRNRPKPETMVAQSPPA